MGTDCIEYGGYIDPRGYGRRWRDGRMQFTHRLAYIDTVGPIPDGLELDHLCRNTRCMNPAHLEPVTHIENIRRRYALQTRVNGHEYTANNTYWKSTGHRDCRICIRSRVAAYRARKAAA